MLSMNTHLNSAWSSLLLYAVGPRSIAAGDRFPAAKGPMKPESRWFVNTDHHSLHPRTLCRAAFLMLLRCEANGKGYYRLAMVFIEGGGGV